MRPCRIAVPFGLVLALPLWSEQDPFRWLESLRSPRSLAWVRARNAETEAALSRTPAFQDLKRELRTALDLGAKLTPIQIFGAHVYSFRQEAQAPRGRWCRTSLEAYRKGEPNWETLLDLDDLSRRESVDWAWGEAQPLPTDPTRVLVVLSRGGADTADIREFDLPTRSFVTGGFALKRTKGSLTWRDRDHAYAIAESGPGSLSATGLPRTVRLWKRGTPLAKAPVVFKGQPEDTQVGVFLDASEGYQRTFFERATDFYGIQTSVLLDDGSIQALDLPKNATLTVHRDWMTVELRTPWSLGVQTHPAGTLLGMRLSAFLKGERSFHVLQAPQANTALLATTWVADRLVITTLEDVQHRVWVVDPTQGWSRQPLQGLQPFVSATVTPVDPARSNDILLVASGFLTPETRYLGPVTGPLQPVESLPQGFPTQDLEVSQNFATSKDGTRIPYFLVAPRQRTSDGSTPVLLQGYGGFEESQIPSYRVGLGRGWLARGGAFALANLRGGLEYGPAWHQAALREGRQRAYEDFAAVADDLVRRGITRPARLGAIGGSNGGLLIGNMLTQFPDRFGALVAQVPLTDLKRFPKLPPGALWIAEYGNPDKASDWAYLQTISPYHALKAGRRTPPLLVTTSTADDRVHPAHARKLAARMKELSLEVLFYESTEGGHGGAVTHDQLAHLSALAYTFLWHHLAKP